ncbi:proton-coupled amino acid transporter-like protein CG1139 isoform X2 [Condylostylus longicornis]|uniref:proton-coupled amino acid transporter-like protein CG1139 isoform X2 n=1 Tax=Condylostylus longicornis TaxID=2530218 RepID=UPI00244DDDF0|nr:proton-coupled amino acid transporter-like protein CG1139 isoform X2 [Condylostylus longicornis]
MSATPLELIKTETALTDNINVGDADKRIPAVITKHDPEKQNGSKNQTSITYGKFQSDLDIVAQQAAGSTLPLVSSKKRIQPDTDNYDPFANRKVEHPTSDFETLVHLLKGSLGSGILAMPLAFSNSGLWFGLFATLFVGLTCTYCVHLLVKCAHILCRRRQIPALSFADVVENAFLDGPPSLQKWSRFMRFIVDTFLVLDLIGCCCIYLVFIATNLQQVLDHYLQSHVNIRLVILALLVPLMLVCLIRNLKYLAPFSFVANVIMFIAIVITMYYIFLDLPPTNSVPGIVGPTHWPMFFGTVIFALEGIGVVMSLENDMKNPKHFIGCPSVLNIGMGTVIASYTLVGFFGYLKYGNETKGSITLNLPIEDILAQSVKIMIAIAIFLTYTLQFYVPIQIIWKGIKHKFSPDNHVRGELVLRTLMVILTVVIAAALPNLGPFITLIGAVCLSSLGVMIPAIVETVVYREDPGHGRFNWRLYKNGFLVVFGIIGFITGTYVSIEEFAETFGSGKQD